jgi:hypothetical protein
MRSQTKEIQHDVTTLGLARLNLGKFSGSGLPQHAK